MGTLQALEVLKEILGLGESLAGKLLIYEALGDALSHTCACAPTRLAGCAGRTPTSRDLATYYSSAELNRHLNRLRHTAPGPSSA